MKSDGDMWKLDVSEKISKNINLIKNNDFEKLPAHVR